MAKWKESCGAEAKDTTSCPTCDGGQGCISCWTHWLSYQWRCLEANVDPADRNASNYQASSTMVPDEIRSRVVARMPP